MSLPPRAIGIAAALAGAIAYGINIVYARAATQQGVSAADLVFLRVFLMLGLVTATIGFAGGSLKVGRPDRPVLALVGVSSAGIGLAYFFAVSFVPIGVAAVIFYTFPLLILIASPFVDGERLTLQRLGVFALAFLGLAVALGPTLGGVDPRGMALAAAASLFAACQFFAAARAGRRVGPQAVLFWSHVVIMPIAGLAALMNGIGQWSALTGAWFAAAMTMLGYLAGFAFQMLSARNAPPALVGLVFCLEPVVAIATANLVLGETLTKPQMVGSLIVLSALVASSLAELRRQPQPA